MPSFRELLDLVKKGATLEAQQQIIELQEAHLATREENVRLLEEVAALKKKLSDTDAIKWEEPYYFVERHGARDGPYCQVCKDADGKLIRLELNRSRSPRYRSRCAVCSNVFEVDHSSDNRPVDGATW